MIFLDQIAMAIVRRGGKTESQVILSIFYHHFNLTLLNYCALIRRVFFTAASRLCLRLGTGGRGQKLLPTVVAAKVERLSIAFDVEGVRFIHGHSADGVFGHGF
jgi:hypothetical protein